MVLLRQGKEQVDFFFLPQVVCQSAETKRAELFFEATRIVLCFCSKEPVRLKEESRVLRKNDEDGCIGFCALETCTPNQLLHLLSPVFCFFDAQDIHTGQRGLGFSLCKPC